MNTISLPGGLDMRFMRESDTDFLKTLYRSTRHDLQAVHDDPDFVSNFIDMQFLAQQQSYSEHFPNALYWVAELNGKSIGRVTIDFSENLVHLVDFSLIPEARGKGYGKTIIESLQKAAHNIAAPLLLSADKENFGAIKLYKNLGFTFEESSPSEFYQRMIWYPESSKSFSIA